jgi:hypothetical protein
MFAEDANRQVSGEPNGAEEQNHTKQHLRSDGRGSWDRRLDGCDEDSRAHKSEHRSESHRDGQQRSENGGEDHLHSSGLAATCGSREEDSANREQSRTDAALRENEPKTQRSPDQSSATRMESLGFAGSYLMLAGCPVTRRSKRTWLSSPVMSCAV